MKRGLDRGIPGDTLHRGKGKPVNHGKTMVNLQNTIAPKNGALIVDD